MKQGIHPENYRPVLFVDNSNGAEFIIGSTVETTETKKASDGKEYPVYFIEISSASHPFFTGTEKSLDSAGRVERFKSRSAAKATEVKKKSVKKAEKRAKRAPKIVKGVVKK